MIKPEISNILISLIIILMIGGVLALIAGKKSPILSRIISLVAVIIDFVIISIVLLTHNITTDKAWILEYKVNWITHFGISIHLAMDGLSLLMLTLTFFLGIIAILISWKEITKSVAFFHFNILWLLAGIVGVFLSIDLFLFYFFWEIMLIPMYFLISIWGHENRIYASYKFFIYTQASGLLMFIAIIALYLIHGANTGVYTFDYQQLIGTTLTPSIEMLLMAGFMIAFIVKLPAIPFHNWLPDAHTEAPTAGSLILAGLMLKTGAYGLIRFVLPLFPNASITFAPIGMILGIIGILYGAKLAFAQTDLKRMIAYTSVSHMGFILLGVFAFNELAYQGVVMQMIAHAITTGALFILVGQIQERIHTRDINKMGGLWSEVPIMGTMGIIFAMASLGLPAFGNFIAEFLILGGTFKANILMSCIASLGLIVSMIYSLKILQKVFYGEKNPSIKMKDLSIREIIVMGSMVIIILYLGLFPNHVLNKTKINEKIKVKNEIIMIDK